MRHLTTFLLSLIFAGATTLSADDQRDDSKQRKQAARQYLEIKYDEFDDLADGGRIIYGPAYNPKATLERVAVEELTKVLPTTTFFRTKLDTHYNEYPELNVIVAVTESDGKYAIRSSVSPTFETPSGKFLALIRGKGAMSDDQRKQLVIGMGKLLAAITHKGHLKKERNGKRHASVELWHDDLHWLDLDVYFDKDNAVKYVLVNSGDKKQKTR